MAAGGSHENPDKDAGLVHFRELQVLSKHPQSKEQLPRSDEARKLLLTVAKQVEPIMKNKGWAVRKLIEIIPPSPNLLGWNQNKGGIIAIRLRKVNAVDSFFDFNHVLGTMLHELVHIEIGPHNAKFYALLDELWSKAEELMDKGITGIGPFESKGYRSGGPLKSNAEMRDARLTAALKRQRVGSLMSGSGKRLGGSRVGKDIRALAAEAAERRAADDVWCQDVVSRGELAGDGGIPQVLQDGGREDTQDLGTKTTSGGKSLCEPGSAASHDDADDAMRARSSIAAQPKQGQKEGKRKFAEHNASGAGSSFKPGQGATRGLTGRVPLGGQRKAVIDLTWDEEASEDDECFVVGASQTQPGQQAHSFNEFKVACPRCLLDNVIPFLNTAGDAPLCSSCGTML